MAKAKNEPQLYVKEFYQNVHMETPIAPGVYPWKQVHSSAIRPLLEHNKAEWVGTPPKEFMTAADIEDEEEDEVNLTPDFFEMNMGELRDYAATHGIAIPPNTKKKDDLIAIIEASFVVKDSEDDGDGEQMAEGGEEV